MKPEPIDRQTERQLLAAARSGDRQAFERLYESHKTAVYNLALYVSRGEEAARELTQQVFVKAFVGLDRFRGNARFGTWLHRMTINLWIDERRRGERVRFERMDDGLTRTLAGGEAADAGARQHEIGRAIRQAVAGLSHKLRPAFVLKYVAGMSYDEIAQTLGCSVGTVSSRLHRCLKALSEELAHLQD